VGRSAFDPLARARCGDRLRRATLVLSILLLAASAVTVTAGSQDAPCVGLVHVPGQGPSCRTADGWEVLLEDGTRMPTHDSGHESGWIPPGTRGARIAAFTGLDTRYWFAIG
jgi:hypothetical protein